MNSASDLMQPDIIKLCLLFLVMAMSSWFGVRCLIDFLRTRNIVDTPNERSMHQGVVPRGGGIVIVLLLIAWIVVLALFTHRTAFFTGLGLTLLGWAGLSWYDDKHDLSPKFRIVAQSLLAILTVCLFGGVHQFMGVPLGWLGPVLTVIGVLWMANLNNFMDGMDGLAAVQSIIANLTLAIWFLYFGDVAMASICVVTMATSYGFLLWNWHPAKIFMGDVGSISLGALYATLIILVVSRHDIPVLSAMFIFMVFIVDATFTVLRRILKGEPFWLPHRSHLYQRAGLAGISHTKIVLSATVMMGLCSLFATFSVLYRDIIVPLLFLTLFAFLIIGFWIVKTEKNAKSHVD